MTIKQEISQKLMKKVVNAIKTTYIQKESDLKEKEAVKLYRERLFKALYEIK